MSYLHNYKPKVQKLSLRKPGHEKAEENIQYFLCNKQQNRKLMETLTHLRCSIFNTLQILYHFSQQRVIESRFEAMRVPSQPCFLKTLRP